MEKTTINNLVRQLNEESDHEGLEASEVFIVEDTIWGLENGVYKPFGELQLPVQSVKGYFRETDNQKTTYHELFTMFKHDFFEGFIARYDDSYDEGMPGSPRYPKIVLDDFLRDNKPLHIYTIGGPRNARKTVHGFFAEFFSIYQNIADVEDRETRECFQRSFIKYD